MHCISEIYYFCDRLYTVANGDSRSEIGKSIGGSVDLQTTRDDIKYRGHDFFERQKCKQKFAESFISSFPWSTSSWTGFVLVVFFAFTWRGLAVGVLIILTMQSGRKWAKRRWWWQAGCYLYQPALLTSPCTNVNTHILIHKYKYTYTNTEIQMRWQATTLLASNTYHTPTQWNLQPLPPAYITTWNASLTTLHCVQCKVQATSWFWCLCWHQCWLCHLVRINTAWYWSLSYTPTQLLHNNVESTFTAIPSA